MVLVIGTSTADRDRYIPVLLGGEGKLTVGEGRCAKDGDG
jgi:hypothetical protein